MVCPEAVTPDGELWARKFFMAATLAVDPSLANLVQKDWYPTIRVSKSGRPPNGCTGLHARSRPRSASAAVTCRGGVVFHMAPVRIVTVTVLPPSLSAGAAVARSGASFMVPSPGVAGYEYSMRCHIRW